MNTIPLNEIFDIKYGDQLDLNKLEKKENGINFISRSKENLGISCQVDIIDKKPHNAGLITVTLGGSYLLSAFIQPKEFYTAQNIKILKPKQEMDFKLKAFYCYCITFNRFRYSSHGREGNKTLDFIPVPTIDEAIKFIKNTELPNEPSKKSIIDQKFELNTQNWQYFKIGDLFDIQKGKELNLQDIDTIGYIPVISATENNNGIAKMLNKNDILKIFQNNCLTTMSNAMPGKTFYQEKEFGATSDINVCIPKFNFNKYIAIFLVKVFNLEQYRFSYGRKFGKDRMQTHTIKLPATPKVEPDWQFMENYIKSLPYSSLL